MLGFIGQPERMDYGRSWLVMHCQPTPKMQQPAVASLAYFLVASESALRAPPKMSGMA